MGIAVRQRRRNKFTFSGKDVCQALGVPSGTLNSWAYHGWFKGLDAEKTTPGKARQFTLEDLVRLAVTKHLVDFGVAAERARPLAALCVQYFDASPMPEFSLSFDGKSEEIGLGEDTSKALVKLTVYPMEIIRTLKERLGVS
jgi:DNA-binding transcriptional MerR regulator